MVYLGGQGDLVSGLIRGITGVTTWVIGVINLLRLLWELDPFAINAVKHGASVAGLADACFKR